MSLVALEQAFDVKKYGGKAGNLARLLEAGLPVPDGLAISADSFIGGKLKAEYKKPILEQTDKNIKYAVRSSALVEDSADASWAGQFESFLNISTGELTATIEKCHGSAGQRAKAYSKSKGDGKQEFSVPVVVQEMIKPSHAGVLFTRDPVTGADQFIVEYAEGLGERIVSGMVTPELVSWSDGPMPVTPFNFVELIELAKKTVQLFGAPQDIEWAEADGKIWLLQARPITTL